MKGPSSLELHCIPIAFKKKKIIVVLFTLRHCLLPIVNTKLTGLQYCSVHLSKMFILISAPGLTGIVGGRPKV